jgi:hypothetical protein
MATDFYFDFRDIFRAGRLGFRGKKMMMHFLGLVLGYVIFEGLTYLSLIGSGKVGAFWGKYGLRPAFEAFAGRSAVSLPLVTIILMAVGAFIWLIVCYLFSTAVAKVAIEELRGDDFYSMKDAFKFACKHWKSIFITMVALIGIFIFCLFWPTLVGLLDLIPGVEQAAEHFGTPLTTFLTIPVYFIALFMVLVTIAFLFGLVLVPSIVAVTGEDTFETIYQLFSIIWNQPWRLVVYEALIMFVKTLGISIFAALSVAGMCMAFLPSTLLIEQEGVKYFADVIARSLNWIGAGALSGSIPGVRAIPLLGDMPWTLDLATFFLSASLIVVVAIILSYPLSIMSCGYTILYVILRRKTTDENMLEVEKEEETGMGMQAEEEEKKEEQEEKAESQKAEEEEGEEKKGEDEKKQ